MENLEQKYAHIKGWGIDADPKNEPTYPMKNWTGADHQRLNWQRPPLQPDSVEVLMSTEHPRRTAVFGTSTPPSGLSGMIRRYAFTFSENRLRRWFTLVLADRVNVFEGMIEDMAQGHIPNTFAERGWKAEWEHNRASFVTKVAVGAVVVGGIAALLYSRNRNSK